MKLETIDLNLLLVFDALASERHVTRAATKLGLSQPALSNALARLRTLLDDPLFERVGGRMEPTPRARQLLAPLSEAIAKMREALERPTPFLPHASEREFRIATNDYAEALLLPALVKRLEREAPSIAIRTVRTDYLFIPPFESLQSGEVDLALGFFGETPQPQANLLSKRLMPGRLVCILRAGHPRTIRRLTLRMLAGLPHARVMYPKNEHVGSIDPLLRSHGLSRRIAVTVPHYRAIPSIVAKSNLLGIVPEWLARREAGRLRLKVFEPPIPLPDVSVVMNWHERFQFDRAHSWLREVIALSAAALSASSSGKPRLTNSGKKPRPRRPRRKA
jgi:DNA-binding transcriptional LysR family regulator